MYSFQPTSTLLPRVFIQYGLQFLVLVLAFARWELRVQLKYSK